MPGLRLLLRSAPFLIGVMAALVWLRRAHSERPRLTAPEPPKPLPERVEHEPIDIVTVVDDLLAVGR